METLLIILMSPIIWSLGDNDYQIRKSASHVAKILRPISVPALKSALFNEDPEIVMRAERVLRMRYVPYNPTLIALQILYCPCEKGKLPWVSEQIRKAYGDNNEVRKEILRIAKEKGISNEGEQFAFDPEYDNNWLPKDLSGVNDLRFRIFGLPSPSDWFSKGGTLEELEKLAR